MEDAITVNSLVSKYLAWCEKHRAPRSYEWYEGHLRGFIRHLGENANMAIGNLKPYHIVEWIDSHPKWGDTYKGSAIVAVKRVYNWADELGYIDFNPIKKLKKPQAKRRENHMTPEDFKNILGHLDEGDPFRDILTFMWFTGCRPQEARHIEPRHVYLDRGCVIIPKEEAKGKRKARIIHLQGEAFEIVRKWMAKPSRNKLFRNARSDAWSKYAICNRMHRLSVKTGRKLCAYDARHGFATRKLKQGHDHLTIAAIMGHTNGSMLATVYSHIDTDGEFLKKALEE